VFCFRRTSRFHVGTLQNLGNIVLVEPSYHVRRTINRWRFKWRMLVYMQRLDVFYFLFIVGEKQPRRCCCSGWSRRILYRCRTTIRVFTGIYQRGEVRGMFPDGSPVTFFFVFNISVGGEGTTLRFILEII